MEERKGFALWCLRSQAIVVGILILVLSSCKPGALVRDDLVIAPIKTALLIDSVKQESLEFDYLSAKLAIKYKGKQSLSLKGNLRMKKDSVIWLSLSPGLGIEAARVLISKDEVQFMNRLEKNYSIYSYQELSEKFNTPLHFDMIQSFLTGNHMLPLHEKELFSDVSNEKNYRISNFSERQLRKIEKGKMIPEELVFMLLVHPEHYRPEGQFLEDKQQDRSLSIRYHDYEKLNNSYLPEKIDIEVKAEEENAVHISFSKIACPDELSFSFRIPSKYDEVH